MFEHPVAFVFVLRVAASIEPPRHWLAPLVGGSTATPKLFKGVGRRTLAQHPICREHECLRCRDRAGYGLFGARFVVPSRHCRIEPRFQFYVELNRLCGRRRQTHRKLHALGLLANDLVNNGCGQVGADVPRTILGGKDLDVDRLGVVRASRHQQR